VSADIAITRDRVQRILTDWLGSATIDRDGEFVIPVSSAAIRISVTILKPPTDDPWFKDDSSLVSVYCAIGPQLMTPELCQFVATADFVFGHLVLVPMQDDSRSANLVISHRLLGDFLDPDELKHVVEMVALISNQVAQEVKVKFAAPPSVETKQGSVSTG
jgi:hypothetical protein